jgi:multimeric flavodoxin WrbA
MIIISGSSRQDGETSSVLKELLKDRSDIEVVHLTELDITPFDYDYKNKHDDFFELFQKMLKVDRVILVTPVYWYTMSAHMKIFLDRWSDMLVFHKELGKQLKGKKIFVVATFGSSIPVGFEVPFVQTASYMGLLYEGCAYVHTGKKDKQFQPLSDVGMAMTKWVLEH